jgi:hypothetical protein
MDLLPLEVWREIFIFALPLHHITPLINKQWSEESAHLLTAYITRHETVKREPVKWLIERDNRWCDDIMPLELVEMMNAGDSLIAGLFSIYRHLHAMNPLVVPATITPWLRLFAPYEKDWPLVRAIEGEERTDPLATENIYFIGRQDDDDDDETTILTRYETTDLLLQWPSVAR